MSTYRAIGRNKRRRQWSTTHTTTRKDGKNLSSLNTLNSDEVCNQQNSCALQRNRNDPFFFHFLLVRFFLPNEKLTESPLERWQKTAAVIRIAPDGRIKTVVYTRSRRGTYKWAFLWHRSLKSWHNIDPHTHTPRQTAKRQRMEIYIRQSAGFENWLD